MIAATIAGMIAGSAALADDGVMASRFGNTTVITNANGNVSKVYYNPDHSFIAEDPKLGIHGTWEVHGDTLCLTFTAHAPPGRPNPECDPVAPHAVGDVWTVGGMTVTIAKGIVP
jgi:hypothetical protein